MRFVERRSISETCQHSAGLVFHLCLSPRLVVIPVRPLPSHCTAQVTTRRVIFRESFFLFRKSRNGISHLINIPPFVIFRLPQRCRSSCFPLAVLLLLYLFPQNDLSGRRIFSSLKDIEFPSSPPSLLKLRTPVHPRRSLTCVLPNHVALEFVRGRIGKTRDGCGC
jgi:hypothetical protein